MPQVADYFLHTRQAVGLGIDTTSTDVSNSTNHFVQKKVLGAGGCACMSFSAWICLQGSWEWVCVPVQKCMYTGVFLKAWCTQAQCMHTGLQH